ncbi:MAG TPA: carboxymuconolactone decarboxylase family protein [Xanthomonadaceae bacterium]|nr:carboxymuconolactone decarboxylase family protein [Xanthomonadaceae bacterium]
MMQGEERGGALTRDVRALIRVSAAIGARWPETRLKPLLVEAQSAAAPLAVEEALLQSYLFVGYPGALRALAVWREVGAPVEAGSESPPEEWPVRGERVCRRVYGEAYDRLRENVAALHPGLDEWMVTEGYGKVLGRSGLPLEVRELCVAAMLAAQGAAAQLYSHLRGALRVGAQPEQVEAMLVEAGEILGPEERAGSLAVWASVRTRSEKPEA